MNRSLPSVFLSVLTALLFSWSAYSQSTPSTILYFYGANAGGDRWGGDVDGLGDVDGDGIPDFIVGSPFAGFGAGQATVYSGLAGSPIFTKTGAVPGEFFGVVSGVGDLNGDGHAEFVVGAFKDGTTGTNAGSITVFSGIDGSVLFQFFGASPGSFLGAKVAQAGDVNGDGIPDILATDKETPGSFANNNSRVLVFSGLDGSQIRTFTGPTASILFGRDIDGVGDVNGDGFDDIIVGAPFANPSISGSTFIISGVDGAILHTLSPVSASFGFFGESVCGTGDVDGDGINDVAVGAPEDDSFPSPSGTVRVFSGADGSLLHYFTGSVYLDDFGRSVDAAGDVNGDGFADILVGQAANPTTGSTPGHAYVYSGFDGSLLTSATSMIFGDNFAGVVAGVGDVNSDGCPDFIVGADNWDGNGGLMAIGNAAVYGVPTFPTKRYNSPVNVGTTLDLSWTPDGGSQFSVTGTITCTGATPGGFGLFGVSLAETDFPLTFGFPLLIANDPINLIFTGQFGFDLAGEFQVPNVSRQNPFLTLSLLYMQAFEFSPSIAGSNGLRMEVTP